MVEVALLLTILSNPIHWGNNFDTLPSSVSQLVGPLITLPFKVAWSLLLKAISNSESLQLYCKNHVREEWEAVGSAGIQLMSDIQISKVMYSTVQYNTIQYITVQYSSV